MADAAALYGLVGAIGGALLGAGAAVSAALLQSSGARRARRWALADAELNRLVAVRSGTRVVLQLQIEAVEALAAGRVVGADEFAVGMDGAMAGLRRALDEALIDGLLIPQTQGTPLTVGHPWSMRRRYRPVHVEYGESTAAMVRSLERLGRDIHTVLGSVEQRESQEAIAGLQEQIATAEDLRRHLMSWLLDRVEAARRVQGGR
ncbi:hypothetical protein ACFT25_16070 [Streptomyces hydrogenans]|uniref:hypothetical protein n=1 Tax=Streptomyces hydrogenans TaxID=1873719 RepID=UPI00363D30C3